MKRVIASLLVLSLAVAPAVAQTSWNIAAAAVKGSAVFIQTSQSSCTGFIINDKAKGGQNRTDDVDYILTAAHCDGTDLYAGQRPAIVKAKDVKKDLMVLEVEDLERPALRLAKKDPVLGEEVASFGYGYGLEDPMFRVAHISNDKIYIPYEGIGGPLFAIDSSFVPGQSGGPVVNAAGEVVLIVQLGTPVVGFGVGAEIIRDKVGRYFGVPR